MCILHQLSRALRAVGTIKGSLGCRVRAEMRDVSVSQRRQLSAPETSDAKNGGGGRRLRQQACHCKVMEQRPLLLYLAHVHGTVHQNTDVSHQFAWGIWGSGTRVALGTVTATGVLS